ncbi:MAG: hypothetical protein RJQ00_03260 [Vicingaceae bacterium]
MSKAKLILAFFFFLALGRMHSYAQLYEMGFHAGYNVSRLTVDEGQLSDEIYVSSGRLFNGGSFGVQFMAGPPKNQNAPFFKIIPSFLLEATLCRCGGNINLISTNPDNSRSLNELEYVFYRGDYSAKFVANMKNLQFMIGPTFTNHFYSGVKVGSAEEYKFAGDQFSDFVVGYEFGLGYKIGSVTLSARYQNHITSFGTETALFPTEYRNYQFKFMLAYFFLSKHKDANWGSIYWN